MYHGIIENKIKNAFRLVNDKNYGKMLPDLHNNVRHSFSGDHALGGIRNDKQTLLSWFQRLGIVLSNLELTIVKIYVKGWPHKTIAIAEWSAKATLANGDSYTNKGVHIITIKWGKIVSLYVYEDSQAVAIALEKQLASGITEAGLPKIES